MSGSGSSLRCLFRGQAGGDEHECTQGVHARGMCRTHYLREWRARSSGDRRAFRRYSEPVMARRRIASRERYRRDPTSARAQTQAWKHRNRSRVQARGREYRQSKRGRFAAYRYTAKRRGIAWDLSFDQFLVLTGCLCAYCSGVSEGKADVGIWRVDRTRGFDWENCVPCCYSCSHRRRRHATNGKSVRG